MRAFPQKHTAADTTIFTVMSTLAGRHGAINLSQGFPDFDVDPRLGQFLAEAVKEGYNQYAPAAGLPQLRERIAKDLEARHGVSVDPDREVTVTPGATYALYTALTALLEPGDEVIILEPAYDSYLPAVQMNGGRAVPVPLSGPGFTVDWDRLRAAVTARTRAILVNTPHNPTGSVWQKEDWDQLAELVRNTDIWIISDEVYEQLVYDGVSHYSVCMHPELKARSFAVFSFGKVYHNTGWKIGYCVAEPAAMQAFRKVHQFLSFSVNTPAQHALAGFLDMEDRDPPAVMMQQRRDFFLRLMRRLPFEIPAPAPGSYFQVAGYAGFCALSDREFSEWLTREYGVAVIPMSAFYTDGRDDKLVRFCFAKKEETLTEAARRMHALGRPAAALKNS